MSEKPPNCLTGFWFLINLINHHKVTQSQLCARLAPAARRSASADGDCTLCTSPLCFRNMPSHLSALLMRCIAKQVLHRISSATHSRFRLAILPKLQFSTEINRLTFHLLPHMATFRNSSVTIADPVPRYEHLCLHHVLGIPHYLSAATAILPPQHRWYRLLQLLPSMAPFSLSLFF
jgi:hypothetical protein